MRTYPFNTVLKVLLAAGCVVSVAGCHQDPSITSAPPAPKNAVAPPTVTQRFPHHRLPPLVVNGKPNGASNAVPTK